VIAGTPGFTRNLLHFGAVDWLSRVWLNGREIAAHTGGYDAFSAPALLLSGQNELNALNELIVFAFDPSELGAQPYGKQNAFSINCMSSSAIIAPPTRPPLRNSALLM